MKRHFTPFGIGVLFGLTACSPLSEQLTVKPTGYNALEIGVTNKGELKQRLFTNLSLTTPDIQANYHGLNILRNADQESYFGRHVFGIGSRQIGLEGIAELKVNAHKSTSERFGFRDYNIIQRLIGFNYGWIDVTANEDAVNVTNLNGKSLGAGFTAEFLQSLTIPFEGRTSHYGELQLFKRFGPHLSLFGRVEANDLRIDDTTTYVGGIVLDF